MTVEALKEVEDITPREAERSKNFFALGLMSWLYGRPIESTLDFIQTKFAGRTELVDGERSRSRPATHYGETSEDFIVSYEVRPAKLAPGVYRNITGNQALSTRPRRRLDPERARPLPRRVPDHAGLGHPRGARALQALRRPHVPGRGRDRGRRRRARRVVRRRAGGDDVGRARNRAEVGDRGARGRARAAARDRRRAARRARRRACRRSPSRPTC